MVQFQLMPAIRKFYELITTGHLKTGIKLIQHTANSWQCPT